MTIKSVFKADFEMGPGHPHGSNIWKKVKDHEKAKSGALRELIGEVASKYRQWRSAAEVKATSEEKAEFWKKFVRRQVEAFATYREFLDDPRLDAFDTRGALQSSALEEFCTFLFGSLIDDLGANVDLGHRDVFHGLYFSSPNFQSFAALPEPRYQQANVDFVICKKLVSTFSGGETTHEETVFVPVVAIECKTYLDRPRWFESEMLSENLKRGFPYCRHYLLAEFLKLNTSKVNIVGSRLDHVYVLRRAENVDRKKRRAESAVLPTIHIPAVEHLFRSVFEHLTIPWEPEQGWKETGVLK